MRYIYTVVVFIFFSLIIYRLFLHIGSDPLVRWDERTNSQVISELVESRTFPYLTYNGEPFFEKPPLWYFLTGFIVQIFGSSLFALRFISALSGLGIMYLVWKMSRQWFGAAGSITALSILLSTNHLYLQNAGGFFSSHTLRSADPDSLQIFFMILSVYCLNPVFQEFRAVVVAGFAFSALAVLTKGILGALPVFVYFVYLFVSYKQQTLMEKKRVHTGKHTLANHPYILAATCVFLLIIAPWYLLMVNTYGSRFLEEHIGYHQIGRIANPLEGHNEPLWFYFQVLENKHVFIGFELLVASMLYLAWRKSSLYTYKTFVPFFLILSIVLIVTVTRTKLAWYILPAYPFAALIIANATGRIYGKMTGKNNRN